MSDSNTVYQKMLVPASEVRGRYVSDSPWSEGADYDGPEHTADLVFNSDTESWRRVEKVSRVGDRITVHLDTESIGTQIAWSWQPVKVLRPMHQPPFDPGVAGYYQ